MLVTLTTLPSTWLNANHLVVYPFYPSSVLDPLNHHLLFLLHLTD
jgi:hypothetical protein